MGTYSVSSFKGVGSVAAVMPFNLAFNDCNTGLTRIQYQFAAPGGVAVPAKGVINLTNDGSTAKGIGLQVTDGNGTPIVFNQSYNLTGVTSSGTSYTVPFKAAYYQTGATVGPGSANAALTFTINYQ